VNIGDCVTVQSIKDQSECRWVVLTDLNFRQLDGYESLESGIIRYIADTKREAGDAICEIEEDGTEAILICGTLDDLCVGGVIVE
jgi:hypothetical protein